MTGEELIHRAHEQGSAAGQIALAEFILKSYGHTLDPRLKRFLEKAKQDCYETVAQNLDMPAEDVALEVSKIADRVVKVAD